jgi:hypothetical protein
MEKKRPHLVEIGGKNLPELDDKHPDYRKTDPERGTKKSAFVGSKDLVCIACNYKRTPSLDLKADNVISGMALSITCGLPRVMSPSYHHLNPLENASSGPGV